MTYWHNDIAHQRREAAEAATEVGAEQESKTNKTIEGWINGILIGVVMWAAFIYWWLA